MAPDERVAEVTDEHAAGDPETDVDGPVVARLDDALERVAHGATVSVPGLLVARGLTVAFTC